MQALNDQTAPAKQDVTIQTFLKTIHEKDRNRVEASLRSVPGERLKSTLTLSHEAAAESFSVATAHPKLAS
jgi:hypothetical protein